MTEPSLSTKYCPDCCSAALVHLTSQNLKLCTHCAAEIPWTLDKGQSSLLTNAKGGVE